MLKTVEVLVDSRIEPIGIDSEKPRFSWKVVSDRDNLMQGYYQIIVQKGDVILWDTDMVKSEQSAYIEYEGSELELRTKYEVILRVWDEFMLPYITRTSFETGMMGAWKADFITHTLPETEACPVFVKKFPCEKIIKTARLYSTALGIYDMHINGRRVSDEYFSPGWTSYDSRLQYQSYDITEYLAEQNKFEMTVANGWYRGNLAYQNRFNIYGDRAAVIGEIHIEYADGTSEVILTDKSWEATTGEIRFSEIYHGETIDKTFTDDEIYPVEVYEYDKSILTSQECEPVRIIKRVPAIELIKTPKGETVIDFGQNLTGFVEFVCNMESGGEITIKHAEVLDQDGNFYLDNMRAARVTDRYTCSGSMDIYRPRFTFHGFRYIKIEGMIQTIDLSKIRACVMHTDMRETGSFKCSDEIINQLQSNIQWGQRSNFLDVPTDCPQRDERLGWTGDAQVFAGTAAYNFGVSLFFEKWLKDLAADQGDNGAVPFVVPDALVREDGVISSSAAWGDAAVIIPWTMYQVYGDKNILRQQYQSMKGWVDYLAKEAGDEYLWKTGAHFGDWLALDMEQYFTYQKFSVNASTGSTDRYYIASAFFAYSTDLMAKIAEALGKADDSVKYRKLHKNIIDAFRKEYITPNGRLVSETQTGMLLALKFNLVEEGQKKALAARLVANIRRHNMQMVTGFAGTPYLCPVLSEYGYHDIAGQLLMQTKYPSWLYPVTKGATTIWERWNGIKPDGSFENPEMNSFNHYAYGAVGEWLYTSILGINALEPGYKKILIAPKPIESLTFAKGSFESIYGEIYVSWKTVDDKFLLDVKIPFNCKAIIEIPGSENQIEIGSGEYNF